MISSSKTICPIDFKCIGKVGTTNIDITAVRIKSEGDAGGADSRLDGAIGTEGGANWANVDKAGVVDH